LRISTVVQDVWRLRGENRKKLATAQKCQMGNVCCAMFDELVKTTH